MIIGTIPSKEENKCEHPPFLRFIQEYEAWGVRKELEMCRNCGKLVKTKILK